MLQAYLHLLVQLIPSQTKRAMYQSGESAWDLSCYDWPPKPCVVQEDDYGRARVHTQWGNDAELIEEAIEMCPVDCIAYVSPFSRKWVLQHAC